MVDPGCLARNRLNLLRRRTATITRCTHKTRHLGSKRGAFAIYTRRVCVHVWVRIAQNTTMQSSERV